MSHGHGKINGRQIIVIPFLVIVAKFTINVLVAASFCLLLLAIDCIVQMGLLMFFIVTDHCIGFLVHCATDKCMISAIVYNCHSGYAFAVTLLAQVDVFETAGQKQLHQQDELPQSPH